MKYFFAIIMLCFLISCNSPSTETPKNEKIEASDSKTISNEKTKKAPVSIDASGSKYQFLVYKGANILSKTTSYLFEDENGERVSIQVSNNPEFAKIKIPSSLLKKDKSATNDDMIGKKVEWIYDNDENIVEVKTVE